MSTTDKSLHSGAIVLAFLGVLVAVYAKISNLGVPMDNGGASLFWMVVMVALPGVVAFLNNIWATKPRQ